MTTKNCSSKQQQKKQKSSTRLTNSHEQKTDIWTKTNYTEERQRIREFWLHLSEAERRSLVKVEKEAVLHKMKEQQRHSCNCSVCGKKRTAIEDELEVLYDAYYEELEQYAYRQQHKYTVIRCKNNVRHQYVTKQEQEEDDDDEEDYRSDSTKSVLSESELTNTLTVSGSIITVADDLLKNDGKKFLDMMERLAETKMRKEKEVADMDDDEDDEDDDDDGDEDEEDEDDDEDDEDEDEDDEEDTRTEEQRMEEGRKMFQVFAARMFEQRVFTAYREKVAQDRQQCLIEELEEEERQRQEKELKKQQDKEKKRDKRRQIKLQQEKERLELENKRKQEELAAKADREQKLKMERQIKEAERLKRQEERRQKEEDRLRKEEEKKKKRLIEERTRLAEKEKKRKEEQQKKNKLEKEKAATSAATTAVMTATTNASAAAAASVVAEKSSPVATEEKTTEVPHHVLTDATTSITPISQRRTSLAGPIGSPVRSRSIHQNNQYVANDSETQYSFFSNFLFGQMPTNREQTNESFNTNRRVSSDGSNLRWSNGWTPLTVLSDNVHGKLFGDVLAGDRNFMILERSRIAYLKLNELASAKIFIVPPFHTLDQLHRMLHDLYYDTIIDVRELYQIIQQFPSSGFKCYYNQHQQCYIVQYGIVPTRSTSSLLPTNNMISPPSITHFIP